MIAGLSVALVLLVLACLWLLDRRDRRSIEAITTLAEAHRLQVTALLERQDREREAHRREIADLCTRLQHPEIVIHQPDPSQPDEEMPLSDEEMAERELMLERLEQIERDGGVGALVQ